jgi:hypothetical protein
MPPKASAMTSAIAQGVTQPKMDGPRTPPRVEPDSHPRDLVPVQKPEPSEYKMAVDALTQAAERIESVKELIVDAIAHGNGKAAIRQDVRAWVDWITKDQILNGLVAWIKDMENEDSDATLREHIAVLQEQLEDAEQLLAASTVAASSKTKPEKPAPASAKGTAGKVTIPVVDYDELEDDDLTITSDSEGDLAPVDPSGLLASAKKTAK